MLPLTQLSSWVTIALVQAGTPASSSVSTPAQLQAIFLTATSTVCIQLFLCIDKSYTVQNHKSRNKSSAQLWSVSVCNTHLCRQPPLSLSVHLRNLSKTYITTCWSLLTALPWLPVTLGSSFQSTYCGLKTPCNLALSLSPALTNPTSSPRSAPLQPVCPPGQSNGQAPGPLHLLRGGLCSNVTSSEQPSLATCHSPWPLSLSIPLSWPFLPSIFYLTPSTPSECPLTEGQCPGPFTIGSPTYSHAWWMTWVPKFTHHMNE